MELDEDTKMELDLKQQVLNNIVAEHPEITVTWFRPDERKEGGAYVTTAGRLKRINEVERTLVLTDGTEIRWRMWWGSRATASGTPWGGKIAVEQ